MDARPARGAATASASCLRNFWRPEDEDFPHEKLLAARDPDDVARVRAAIADTIENDALYDIEYRLLTPRANSAGCTSRPGCSGARTARRWRCRV
ncbi:PAS domain-containing protein, partial [Escherichia coli]|nr:PAS domain-containing protein [Escherichia coli]